MLPDVLPQLRPAIDSRPPGQQWPAVVLPSPAQPPLLFGPDHRPPEINGRPAPLVSRAWVPPDPSLPDAKAWGASLAQAMVEVMAGVRPSSQLTRWADEYVVATLNLARRQRAQRTRAGRPPGPAVVRSLRVQHPGPRSAEVSAHLRLDRRSVAMAFRLEGREHRWLCTALELTGQPALARSTVSPGATARSYRG